MSVQESRPSYQSRSSAPLRLMPFGKHKGKPLKSVPGDYIDWLLNQDIDERLRNALTQARATSGTSQPAPKVVDISERQGDALSTLVEQFLEAREQALEAKFRVTELRQKLLPVLAQSGGSHLHEPSGQRVSIEERPRWEYDPTRLHTVVAAGRISEDEFARSLQTVVDKTVVAEWLTRGLAAGHELNEAKVVTKVLQQIVVKAAVAG